jgi:serine/threonine protein kinase
VGLTRRNKCTTELTPGAYLQGKQATYYLHCVLGKGCFAEVFKAETLEKKTYAIKVIPREKSVPKQHYEDEANRLQALCHPNVVSALEAFTHHGTQATYCCIVTEFCGGGTLLDRIKRQDPAEFTPKQITRYLYQIASGLDYLHSSGYMHGDLKSDNILLTRRRQPKISDFGHSRLITEGTDGDKPVGDLMFAPPEYTRARMVSAAFDMWSLGCILCEMATRRTTHSRSVGMPFAANRPAFGQMMQEIRTVHGGTFLPLIQELCEVDPKQRMSAARVVEYAEGMGGAVEPRDNDDGDRHGIIRRMLRELKESMRIDM